VAAVTEPKAEGIGFVSRLFQRGRGAVQPGAFSIGRSPGGIREQKRWDRRRTAKAEEAIDLIRALLRVPEDSDSGFVDDRKRGRTGKGWLSL
jgi:hypothetical protein